jgi:hypothetical protein
LLLEFPRSLDLPGLQAALGTFSGLPTSTAVVFEFVAEPDRLQHYLVVGQQYRGFIEPALRAAIPGLRLTLVETFDRPIWQAAVALRPSNRLAPLRADSPTDVAAAVLASVSGLRVGERAIVQVVLRPATVPAIDRPSQRRRLPHTSAWLIGREPLDLPTYAQQVKKRTGPVFAAAVRLAAVAPTPRRARAITTGPLTALRGLRAPGVRILRRLAPAAVVSRAVSNAAVPLVPPFLVNGSEAAALLAWPVGVLVPGLRLAGAVQLPPTVAHPNRGLVIGRATFPGREGLVALRYADLTRHRLVVGGTGTGKTYALAGQTLAAFRAGYGGVAIDPKGDLSTYILDRLTADEANRVIVVDPTADPVVGLNLLDGPAAERDGLVDQTVAALRRRFPDGLGPRSEDLARAALLTLTYDRDATLADLPTLLGPHPGLRRRLIPRLTDPSLKGFWHEFEGWSPEQRAAIVAPLGNKVRSVLLRGPVRAVVGQPSAFSFDAVIARRDLVLVDLAAAAIGWDAAGLLASLLLDRVWTALQRRRHLPPERRRPFLITVDEFGLLADSPALTDGLSLGRVFGAAFGLAVQHLSQLSPATRAAVLANVANKLFFALSATDAAEAARELAPYVSAADIQNLGAHEAVASLTVAAAKLPPVTVKPEPLPEPTGLAATVRRQSAERYGVRRRDVEARLAARAEDPGDLGPIGRRAV